MNRGERPAGVDRPNAVDRDTIEAFVLTAPFHRWLGLRVSALDERGIEIELPWREELVSNVRIRSTHGGILASLIDLSGLFAVVAKTGAPAATVDLRVDYHRTATPGPLRARAELVKLGAKISSAETRILDEGDELVASGRGVYLTTE